MCKLCHLTLAGDYLLNIFFGLQRNHLTDKPQHAALQCKEHEWDHWSVVVGEASASVEVDQSRTNAHYHTGVPHNPLSDVRSMIASHSVT